MRILILATLSVVFSLCLTAIASAQTDVTSIDAYAKRIDAFTAANKRAVIVVADTSNYEDAKAKPKWQKFVSEKALETFRNKTEVYDVALNWRRGGKIVASNLTLSSPSGDWAKYVYQYFREDGSLAKVKVDYRTFMGDLIILQDIYFSPAGKLLKKTSRFEDLTTHKPKKVKKDSYDPGMLNEADYYKTTSKLPFARAIR